MAGQGVTLREELEAAIEELDAPLEEDPLELEFQRWFEAHPSVMRALNYREAIPHPKLIRPDGFERHSASYSRTHNVS